MSGGSFDYLFTKFESVDEDAFSWSVLHSLEAMADDMATEGFHDVAVTMHGVAEEIRRARARVQAKGAGLQGVMHAWEWWRSGDRSREQAVEAIEKWRGG